MQSQALSGTRARCGPGGYIQVGMRGCVYAPHLHDRWWKIESLLLSRLPPSGGRGLVPARSIWVVVVLVVHVGVPIDGGVCVLLLCLPGAWLCIVELATPGGSGDAVALGAYSRGVPWRDSWRGPKTWILLGDDPPGDFRERDGCGWGEIARLRGFHVTNRLIYRRVS